jgi:hypothetical protein
MTFPLHIVIGPNVFGAGNFGDDLMLAGFVDRLPSAVRITAFTPHDIESQRRRFPQVTWLADDDAARDTALEDAVMWLALGDTPFQLDSGPWMLDFLMRERERCARSRIPMVYLGVGCESEAAAQDPRSRALLAAATRVWTRDGLSTELLSAAYPGALIQTGSDLAHLEFELGVSPTPEPGVLGLLIAYEREGVVPARALEDCIEGRPGAPMRWLIQEERSFPHTERWNYAALSEPIRQQLSVMPFDYHSDSVDAYLAHFGSPEIVVSTRYHATLVAAWHGSRVGVIARSTKLRGIAEDLDLPWTERIATAADLRTLIERARPARPERLSRQSARAATMCDEFFAWLRES